MKDAQSNFPLESKHAEDSAVEFGMVVVYPAPNQLQIDIDSDAAYRVFKANIAKLKLHWPFIGGIQSIDEHPSKSGLPCRHITVNLKDALQSNLERIVIQLCLGSDPLREMLSYLRVLKRDEHPTLFMERKEMIAIKSIVMPTPIEKQLIGSWSVERTVAFDDADL